MPESSPPPSDRRRALRHLACFPAYVDRSEHETQTALISDLSVTGASLLVRGRMAEGDHVKLQLFISPDMQHPRSAAGHIVRVAPLPDDRRDLWTHEIGVEFEWALTLYAAEIDAMKARQTVEPQ